MSFKEALFIGISLLLIGSNKLLAQDTVKKQKQDFPISISLTSHSWAFPMSELFRFAPYYPGLAVSTEYYYIKREKSKLFQTAEIGGFLNNSSGSALYLNSNFGYRHTTKFGLATDISIGLGYFYGFHSSTTYKQNSTGEYIEVKDRGIPSTSANFAIGIGYDLSKISDRQIVPFLRYQWIASTNYWSIIGIRPNGLLHLGIQVSIF